MPGICRTGDTVLGYCSAPGHPANHEFTGVWITGSGTSTSDGLGIVRVGDLGSTDCGHTFTAATGSSIVTSEGIDVVRVEDTVLINEGPGTGITVTGSDTVTSD